MLDKKKILLDALLDSSLFSDHMIDWDFEEKKPYIRIVRRLKEEVFESTSELAATLRELADDIDNKL